jgi:hypothetical protein
MSAAFAFEYVAPKVSVHETEDGKAYFAKCEVCRYAGRKHKIASQKGHDVFARQDKAYEAAAFDQWAHADDCEG